MACNGGTSSVACHPIQRPHLHIFHMEFVVVVAQDIVLTDFMDHQSLRRLHIADHQSLGSLQACPLRRGSRPAPPPSCAGRHQPGSIRHASPPPGGQTSSPDRRGLAPGCHMDSGRIEDPQLVAGDLPGQPRTLGRPGVLNDPDASAVACFSLQPRSFLRPCSRWAPPRPTSRFPSPTAGAPSRSRTWTGHPRCSSSSCPSTVLFDESQEVAKAYRAACMPDFFLFDGDRQLVYRGQFDASRPSSGARVTGSDLRAAMDSVLAGKEPSPEQAPSVGCNIKWRRGNEPEWFG